MNVAELLFAGFVHNGLSQSHETDRLIEAQNVQLAELRKIVAQQKANEDADFWTEAGYWRRYLARHPELSHYTLDQLRAYRDWEVAEQEKWSRADLLQQLRKKRIKQRQARREAELRARTVRRLVNAAVLTVFGSPLVYIAWQVLSR